MDQPICEALLGLPYLASSKSFCSLEFQFNISSRSISRIVTDVCSMIFEQLEPNYLRLPQRQKSWLEIPQKIEERWNFPSDIGATDGKQIVTEQPCLIYDPTIKVSDRVSLLAMLRPKYDFL